MELGRYINGHYVHAENRICPVCENGVEDEMHILLKCTLYGDLQDALISRACDLLNTFNNLSDTDQFVFLMSSPAISRYTAKTYKLILDRRRLYFKV